MTRKTAALALLPLLCIAPPLAAQGFEGTVTSDNGNAHAMTSAKTSPQRMTTASR